MKSVIKNLDRNADHALSRSDLNTYWDRLGGKSERRERERGEGVGGRQSVHSTS